MTILRIVSKGVPIVKLLKSSLQFTQIYSTVAVAFRPIKSV